MCNNNVDINDIISEKINNIISLNNDTTVMIDAIIDLLKEYGVKTYRVSLEYYCNEKYIVAEWTNPNGRKDICIEPIR